MDLPAVYPAPSPDPGDRRCGTIFTDAYRARLREMYGDTFVLLPDLAVELRIDRCQLRRFVIRMGFTVLALTAPPGTRSMSRKHPALSVADADAVRALHAQQRARALPRFRYSNPSPDRPRTYLRPVSVYALADPRTDQVRYVGVAVDPKQRYAEHCVPTFRGKNIHRYRWIAQLRALGLKPTLTILETCATGPEAVVRERYYIALLRTQGASLVNKTDGGDGIPGYTHPPAVRAVLSALHKGIPESAQTRAKLSALRTGKKRTASARAADTVAARQRWQDPDYRQKTSAAIKRSFADHPERAAKISAARTAYWRKWRQDRAALQLPLPL